MILTIILFFVYCWGFGNLAGFFVKESEEFFERHLMRIGIGLATMLATGLLLNLLRIPLDWKIFLALSILFILIQTLRKIKNKIKLLDFKNIKINPYSVLVLMLFFVTLFMYVRGAFAYPYLEDDDSWNHAIGVKYVALEKTVFDAEEEIRYVDAYPPTYDLLMGIMHQTNKSLYWTLKFFNALIISLSILFFFYFVKELTKSSKVAFFSAFVLFAMPAYASHFIWAVSMSMALFFIPFYCLEKIRDDKKWWIISAIAAAPVLVSSPTHGTFFGIFLMLYIFSKTIVNKKFLFYDYLGAFGGVFLSFILWWLPSIIRHGINGTVSGMGSKKFLTGELAIFNVPGTGDRFYKVADFLCAPGTPCYQGKNAINNPIGLGIILSIILLLFLVFLLFKQFRELKKHAIPILLITLAINGIMLTVLDKGTVKKYLPDGSKIFYERSNPPPFTEFLSDQFFLVIGLLLISFLIVKMLWLNFKNKENKADIDADTYVIIIMVWLMFAFYAVKAAPFAYKLNPFRAWMIFAIPSAILIGEGINKLHAIARSLAGQIVKNGLIIKTASVVFLILLSYAIIQTSFVPKYRINTSQWQPGAFWASGDELQGYIWFKGNVDADARVFTFSNNALVIGFDKFICHWCPEVREYQEKGFNQTAEENYKWMRDNNYDYTIIDGQTAKKFGIEETTQKLQGYADSGKFNPVHSTNGFVLFKLN